MAGKIILSFILVLSLTSLVESGDRKDRKPVEVVSSVDLTRYAGKWYEIARIPNRFQKDCASDVTADYTLRDDGKIRVINQCRKASGKIKTAKGTAKVVDKTTNAKLKVTFFWPFSGDYWIIDLGEDYDYVVVGDSKRKYLWILSRSPQMEDSLYEQLLSRIVAQGYDTSKIVRTSHPEQ